jgi:hypothetical protein
MISSWKVAVAGETRPRILKITGVGKNSEGTFLLEAAYGYADERQTSIHAEAVQTNQEFKLVLTTQANTKIVAIQMPNGEFEGTFTLKNGVTKGVTITKLSDIELQLAIDAAKRARTSVLMVPPKADVPESCAAFYGVWEGKWNTGSGGGGYSTFRIWVPEVETDCTAKFSYKNTNSGDIPTGFGNAQIKQGVLSARCGADSEGCSFERHGDQLWGRYFDVNPKNNNTGVFARIR